LDSFVFGACFRRRSEIEEGILVVGSLGGFALYVSGRQLNYVKVLGTQGRNQPK
jgi:hypothetical protein